MCTVTQKERQTVCEIIRALKFGILRHNCNVIKIFSGSPDLVYYYERNVKDSPYYTKEKNPSIAGIPLDNLYNALVNLTNFTSHIKVARLENKQSGIRVRFANETMGAGEKILVLDSVLTKIVAESAPALEPAPSPAFKVKPIPVPVGYSVTPGKIYCTPTENSNKVQEKKGAKMESFSLSNIKDAIINKVTHLDKKTITILAIIALVLLIVGKYQDIKDILVGIKDKVKRSKNFKAMVEDGTNAINGLKKIVGIKDKGVTADEA